jgi:GNAT superfamily N-acetyltransferase
MVAWTNARAIELNLTKIEVSCIDVDVAKKDFLISNGFKQFDDPYVCMKMDLVNLPGYTLPKEYTFVTINDRPDLTGLTGEENLSEEYERMYQTDEFRDDLAIRICYKSKIIVAGCICWFDDIDNCGLFEPVGTSAEHRCRGLAYASMAKTLENLKNHGAKTAYVHTSADNTPAIKLYEKLGFKITNIDHGYELEIS